MLLTTCTELINGLLPEPQAGLLNGMLFGVKTTLDIELKNSLTSSGTLYILAHSGATISVLVAMASLVLLRFLRRPIANIVSVAIIIGYVWLVGPSASVVRAAIMGVISLAAVSLGRQKWPILAWILAVALMLLLNPLWIGDPSFQISVMAALGIILFGKRSRQPARQSFAQAMAGGDPILPSITSVTEFNIARLAVLRFLYDLVSDDLRVTLAAQVFTVPIIMIQFHRISLVSPLSNVLIGWIIPPIMALGFLLVIGGLILPPIGILLSWTIWVPLTYVIVVIEWTSKLPFASVTF